MKYYGYSPVRISLCNGGDTEYYVQEMGWSNLINASLASTGYKCIVEESSREDILYTYINNFHNTANNILIKDLNGEGEEKARLVTATIKKVNPSFKGTIKVITNAPEKSGLGGSSSLVVSIIKALIKTTKEKNVTPEKIAWLAYEIERKILGIKGGYQDQWAASFGGGVNYLEFHPSDVFLEPLWLPEKLMRLLESSICLFFIEPRSGDSGNIHHALETQIKKKAKETKMIMVKRRENVVRTRAALLQGNILEFARLLNEEHLNKEKLVEKLQTDKSKVIYEKAMSYGAIAGKISGAGAGGCAIFIYSGKNKELFIKKMESLGCKNISVKLERLDAMGRI